jgi:hypothetical protein
MKKLLLFLTILVIGGIQTTDLHGMPRFWDFLSRLFKTNSRPFSRLSSSKRSFLVHKYLDDTNDLVSADAEVEKTIELQKRAGEQTNLSKRNDELREESYRAAQEQDALYRKYYIRRLDELNKKQD